MAYVLWHARVIINESIDTYAFSHAYGEGIRRTRAWVELSISTKIGGLERTIDTATRITI